MLNVQLIGVMTPPAVPLADSDTLYEVPYDNAVDGWNVATRVVALYVTDPATGVVAGPDSLSTRVFGSIGMLKVAVTVADGAGDHEVVLVGEQSGTVTVRLVAVAQALPATR